jgi:hypothetical protein
MQRVPCADAESRERGPRDEMRPDLSMNDPEGAIWRSPPISGTISRSHSSPTLTECRRCDLSFLHLTHCTRLASALKGP